MARLASMDMLKGFAIIMVIAGHAVQYLISGHYYDKEVYRLIYSFHMPLFMAITGFFASGGGGKYVSVKQLAKRTYHLLLPLVVYAFVMRFILHAIPRFSGCLIYNLWFLKSALCCTILFAITYLAPSRLRWIAVILTLVLSQFLLIFNLKYMYPCFLGGAWLRNNMDWFMSKKKTITITSGIIWVVMVLFFDEYFWSYISVEEHNILPFETLTDSGWWFILIYRTVLGLAGSLMFFGLFEAMATKGFHHTFIGRILNKVGQETLWIYVLQTAILEVYLPRYLNFDNIHPLAFYMLTVPLVSATVLAISMLIILGIRQALAISKRCIYKVNAH